MAIFDLISLVNQGKSEKEILAALIQSFNTSQFHTFIPDSFDLTSPTPTGAATGSNTKAHITSKPGYGFRGETDITYNRVKLKDYFISLLGSVVHRPAARGEVFDDLLEGIEIEYGIKINREFFANINQVLDPTDGTAILKSKPDSFVFNGDYTVPLVAKQSMPIKIKKGQEGAIQIDVTGISEADGSTLNYTVDWGNGISETYYIGMNLSNSSGAIGSTATVTFHSGSDIEVHIYGGGFTELESFGFYAQIKRIYFKDAIYLTKVPNSIPTNLKSFEGMFQNCPNFNDPNIVEWDTHRITSMKLMFNSDLKNINNVYKFNQPLNNWDTGQVVDMSYMFQYIGPEPSRAYFKTTVNNYKFNQPLNNWNVSNVTNMERMFSGAFIRGSMYNYIQYFNSFNQDISMWDVSSVTAYGNFNSRGNIENEFLPTWPA